MKYQPGFVAIGVALTMFTGSQGLAAGNYQTAFVATEKARDYPVRGTPDATVLKNHGEPAQKKGPVGVPPISAWTYQNFTVYFEGQLVITSVADDDKLPQYLEAIQ